MTELRTAIILDDAGYQAAARRVVEANQKIGEATLKVVDTKRQLIPATTGSASAFDRLKRSLDPVYDAQKKIEKATRDANAAINAGRATTADKANVLAKLTAQLTPATGGMRSLATVSEQLKTSLSGLGGHIGMAGNALQALGTKGLVAAGVIGAIVVTMGAVVRGVRSAMSAFDDLGESADRLGISVQNLQELKYGFNQAGVDAQKLEGALTKLNEKIGTVIEQGAETPAAIKTAFSQLNISMADVIASGGDLTLLLPKIAEGTKNLGTQAERTAVLKALMGKQAAALIPTLLGGADGLDEMAKAANNAGAVLDKETVKKLGDAKDKMDALDSVMTVQNARAFAQFSDMLVQAKQHWVDFITVLNNWGEWLDRQNWAGGVLSWLDKVIAKTRQVGPLSLVDEAQRLAGDSSSSSGGLRVELNTPRGTPAPPAQPGAAWPKSQAELDAAAAAADKVSAQLNRELDLVERWKLAWMQADGYLLGVLRQRRLQELRHAEETIKDAQRLADAKDYLNKTFDIEEFQTAQGQMQRLTDAQKVLAEQLQAIDEAIFTQHIADLKATGQQELAIREELAHQIKQIEEGSNVGTIEQQTQQIDLARKAAARQTLAAVGREQDALGSARAEAARRDGNMIEALEIEHQQRLRQIADSDWSPDTKSTLLQAEDAKSAQLISDAEQTRFTDWLSAQPPLIQDLTDAMGDFASSAADAFTEAVINGAKLSDTLMGLAEDLQKVLLKMLMMKLIEGGLNAAIGGMTSSTTTGTTTTTGDASWVQTRAHGGIFDHGNVVPFARGGVVHQPTFFPMARGMGLMGEAGPEAVVPLKRLPDGNLGVASSGGGSKVTVNVINNAGAKVTTEEKQDENGGMNISVVIDAVEQAMAQRASRPGTTLNRALATAANPVRAR
jgi:lambda family phage tail tape measure protein